MRKGRKNEGTGGRSQGWLEGFPGEEMTVDKATNPCCVPGSSVCSPETRIFSFQVDLFVPGKSS